MDTAAARARGLLYGLLSLFFLPDFDEKRLSLARNVLESLPKTGVERFDSAVGDLREALAGKEATEIREEFERLFIVPFEGAQIPLEASYYLEGKLFGPSLARLRELLGELGLARGEGVSEPEDHLGVLLAFMEAATQQNSLIQERELFYNFLRPCARGVTAKLEKEAFLYGKVAEMLEAFLELEERFFEEA